MSNDMSQVKKRVLAGKYLLQKELARGGSGRVFQALQLSLQRRVAVKVMVAGKGQDDFETRFFLEAKSVAALSHQHIVTVHDYGQTENGLFFLAMELLDGPTIGQSLKEGAFPIGDASVIVTQIAKALEVAHAGGLVHRDLKPGNVILTRNEDGIVAKVLDFGLAKVYEKKGEEEGNPITRDGLMLGTPRYMSPEQIVGKAISPATDIYSLGVMFYEMISGTRAFVGANDIEILHAQIKTVPKPLHEVSGCEWVPIELSRLVAQCVSLKPEDRLQSAKEFRFALRDALKEAFADENFRTLFNEQSVNVDNTFDSMITPSTSRRSSLMPKINTSVGTDIVVSVPEKERGIAGLLPLLILLPLLAIGIFWFLNKDKAQEQTQNRPAAVSEPAQVVKKVPAPEVARVTPADNLAQVDTKAPQKHPVNTVPEGLLIIDSEGKVLGKTPMYLEVGEGRFVKFRRGSVTSRSFAIRPNMDEPIKVKRFWSKTKSTKARRKSESVKKRTPVVVDEAATVPVVNVTKEAAKSKVKSEDVNP